MAVLAQSGDLAKALLTTEVKEARIGFRPNGIVLKNDITAANTPIFVKGATPLESPTPPLSTVDFERADDILPDGTVQNAVLQQSPRQVTMQQSKVGDYLLLQVGITGLGMVYLAQKNQNTDECSICKGIIINGENRNEICKTLEALATKAGLSYKTIIENRLCKANITNLKLAELAGNLQTLSTANLQRILNDINETAQLQNNLNGIDKQVIVSWQYLYEKHATKAEFARKDFATLTQFSKLSDVVKEYIVKFSDVATDNSSLKKFCTDLAKPLGGGSDVKFIDYVNNVDNLNVVKNFVGHKLNDTAFDPDYEQISEAEADNSLVGLAQDWVKRSAAWRKTQGYMQDGRDYGNHAAKNLLSPNSTLARDLGINMNEYYLFREVYLYVQKGVPNKEDQFTKADILLVKYNALDQIDNVILLETKISGSTEYTPRQKQSYRIIENGVGKIGVFELKSLRQSTKMNPDGSFNDNGDKTLSATDNNTKIITINKVKAFKVSDHGLKNGVLEVSPIPTQKYVDYVAPDNK
ncbi:MAG: hypothetical protein MUF12_05815 [Sediminibacterium sp.]|jgi:hypothetical protein|nr:hypothetical protein [Sediminibacterium sp.]